MNPDARILSAPGDSVFAVIAYLIVMLALFVVLATSRSPAQRAVRLLFLYLSYGTFEIAVKRLTHFAWYAYPIKFILFAIALAAWWTARPSLRAHRLKPPMVPLLSVYIALVAVQVFNPNQANPLVGVVGWMTEFMYIAFYFLAFDLLRGERELHGLLWLTAWLGVISALSCLAEMWYGAERLQQMYPTFVPLLAYPVEGGVLYRPTSLVPYIEVFGVAAMVALIAVKGRRLATLLGGIALCVVASLFHAVRITWIVAILFLVLFTLLERRKSLMGTFAVVACVFLAMQQFNLTGGSLGPSLESLTTPVQTFQQNRLNGLMALPQIVSDYPLGIGIGEGSPGLRFIGNGRGTTRLGTHNYFTDLAGELSLAGPLLFLAFGIGIGRLAVRALGARGTSDGRRAALKASAALFGAMLISFFGGGALGAYPQNEYFWLLAGVIARSSIPAAAIRPVPRNRMMGRQLPRMRVSAEPVPGLESAR